MSRTLAHSSFVDSRRRYSVLVGLMHELDRSSVREVTLPLLHSLWYLANVLTPLWRIKPFDAAVLKTERQPYFPMLQRDVDALVGMGMLRVTQFTSVSRGARLQGCFALHYKFSDPVIEMMQTIPEEQELLEYLGEVVQAFERLSYEEQVEGSGEDASYSDPGVDYGNVVDLGEWLERGGATPTADVLDRIDAVAGRDLLPVERMEIYVDHLGRRLRSG